MLVEVAGVVVVLLSAPVLEPLLPVVVVEVGSVTLVTSGSKEPAVVEVVSSLDVVVEVEVVLFSDVDC